MNNNIYGQQAFIWQIPCVNLISSIAYIQHRFSNLHTYFTFQVLGTQRMLLYSFYLAHKVTINLLLLAVNGTR